MTVPLALYDRARAAMAASRFDATAQTKIALFVGTAKVVNAAIMFGFEMHPDAGVAYPFVHGQYFRECEFASLLARVTHWARGPLVYVEATAVTAPLWLEWSRICVHAFPVANARAMYGALALGHALLARVRLAPVIHDDADPLDPFVVAIRRIEQEGGRMIQAQIRLLKDGGGMLDAAERERIIEDRQASVDGAFTRFLGWLAGDAVDAFALPHPLPMIMQNIASLPPFGVAGVDFLRALQGVPARMRAAAAGSGA
jgi:hypothetical protein